MFKSLFGKKKKSGAPKRAKSFEEQMPQIKPRSLNITELQNDLKVAKAMHKDAKKPIDRDRAWRIFNVLLSCPAIEGNLQTILNASHVNAAMAICLRREKKFKQALELDISSMLFRVEYSQRDLEIIDASNDSRPRELRPEAPIPSASRNYIEAWKKDLGSSIGRLAKTNKNPELSAPLEKIISTQFHSGGYMTHCADAVKKAIESSA